MTEQKVDAFFYGLYMDAEFLRSLGIEPGPATVAKIDGYELDFRGAVKAVRRPGSSVWGVIFRLTEATLEKMYSGPATKLYTATELTAMTLDGKEIQVSCYNQPVDTGAPLNFDYIRKLVPAMERMGVPSDATGKVRAVLKRAQAATAIPN